MERKTEKKEEIFVEYVCDECNEGTLEQMSATNQMQAGEFKTLHCCNKCNSQFNFPVGIRYPYYLNKEKDK